MAITITWHDESRHILYVNLVGQWDWDEFQEALHDLYGRTNAVPDRVDYIANLLSSGPLPKGTIQWTRQALFQHPDNWGVTAIVHNSTFVELLAGTFSRIYPQYGPRFLLARSLEEAEAIIERERSMHPILA